MKALRKKPSPCGGATLAPSKVPKPVSSRNLLFGGLLVEKHWLRKIGGAILVEKYSWNNIRGAILVEQHWWRYILEQHIGGAAFVEQH